VKLHLSPNLSLPLDAVTQTFALLANRGAGKTYTASVFAEELLEAKQQVVVVDPMGVWWGLRSSADGKSAGYPIIILGGEHADVPLEETGGKIAAKFIVDTGQSVILDLSHLRKNAQKRFMVDFAEELYHLNRTAIHILLDEADAFAPQKAKGDERLLGAISDWVRRGRARGIGVSLITQRSAVINKDVLELAETLIVLRTGGPRNIDAVLAWVEHHGVKEKAQAMLESLPSMPNGDAWVWSPSWLGIFTRTHIRERRTFDSSRTPKPGERAIKPKAVAPVDLEHLSAEMKATAERAKADDPKELKKRIAQLEAEVRKKAQEPSAAAPDQGAIERAVKRALDSREAEFELRDRKVATKVGRLAQDITRLGELARAMQDALPGIGESLTAPLSARTNGHAGGDTGTASRDRVSPRVREFSRVSTASAGGEPSVRRRAAAPTVDGVTKSMQRILDAVAALARLGISPAERIAVAFFAGYTENGHFNNMVGTLRTMGLVDYPQGNMVQLTAAGEAAASPNASPITTLRDLHGIWLSKVSPSEARLLAVVLEAFPDAISRAELAEKTGYTEDGHFNNMVGHLHTLGAFEYPKGGYVVASDVLFPAGLS